MAVETASLSGIKGRGPVRREERALAPDLVRGVMLLCIALANAAGAVFGGQPGAEPQPEGVERAVNLLLFTFVHCRAYPVFAVMFGYGLVQLARRQEQAGAPPQVIRSLLLRRNAWLLAFGFVHALLLYFGDFLAAYGLVGIIASVVLLPRGDRVQRLVLWIWGATVLHILLLAALLAVRLVDGSTQQAIVPFSEVGSLQASDYASSVLNRLAEWPAHTVSVLPFIIIVWLGIWAARRRILEDAAAHRQLLHRVAAVGLGIAVAGGLPLALASAGLLHADSTTMGRMFVLHQGSGMLAGPGYVALGGLAALARSGSRSANSLTGSGSTGRVVTVSLVALGQRSLSGYLFQSVAWILLLSPYTLALGRQAGRPVLTAVAIAALVWLATLIAAFMLDRRSCRGPAESLLRQLTYGNRR